MSPAFRKIDRRNTLRNRTMNEISKPFTGALYRDTIFPCGGMNFCGPSPPTSSRHGSSTLQNSGFCGKMQKFGSYHLQRLPGWGKMPVHVSGETAASVSWSINSCFFGAGNRVKKQGWILFSLRSVATAGNWNRMSGSFFTFGLRTGHLRGRAPPIGAGCPAHSGRAPPVCVAVSHPRTARHFDKTMNQKRETHNFASEPVPLNPTTGFYPIGRLDGHDDRLVAPIVGFHGESVKGKNRAHPLFSYDYDIAQRPVTEHLSRI